MYIGDKLAVSLRGRSSIGHVGEGIVMDDSSQLDAQPAASARQSAPPDVLAEYLSIRESASHVSDRRDRANDVLTGINA